VTPSTIRQVLHDAVRARVCPAAVVEVGRSHGVLHREAFGALSYETGAPAATDDTVFDLASLTKVLATTSVVMQLVERGQIALDDPVGQHVPAWRGADRDDVTIRDLLAHCSGLPAWRPYYQTLRGIDAYVEAIAAEPLDYAPGTRSEYSDLGFIVLGAIAGRGVSLDERFVTILQQMGVTEEIQFLPPALWRARTAPTEHDPWRGRLLVGDVHDENAWALGGVAGHAGLFGTAGAVGACARHLLQVLDGRTGAFRSSTAWSFVRRRVEVPASSRALGWDTMLPTSSCGSHLSVQAFGHTGFTGTSLWIDPETDLYVVLLTNRVHPTRQNEGIGAVRRALHDAVVADLGSSLR
jgi:CubicO group peptidase (beta-lactamase class C family)